jgi:hypothetical protein
MLTHNKFHLSADNNGFFYIIQIKVTNLYIVYNLQTKKCFVRQYTVTRLVTVDGVLDWQLDLLQSYTQVQYNWVSPDSLSLTIHAWIYHNNSAAIVTAATLVTGELQVPFLPCLVTNSLNRQLQTLQQLQLTTENSEVYDLWSDCRGDSAFGMGCLAIT